MAVVLVITAADVCVEQMSLFLQPLVRVAKCTRMVLVTNLEDDGGRHESGPFVILNLCDFDHGVVRQQGPRPHSHVLDHVVIHHLRVLDM